MRDDLNPGEERSEEEAPRKEERRASEDPTVSDREVPLNVAHTPEAIHAWLDGESINEDQLHSAEKEYSFWRRVEQETGARRRMKTPSSLPGQIMRAIKKDE